MTEDTDDVELCHWSAAEGATHVDVDEDSAVTSSHSDISEQLTDCSTCTLHSSVCLSVRLSVRPFYGLPIGETLKIVASELL